MKSSAALQAALAILSFSLLSCHQMNAKDSRFNDSSLVEVEHVHHDGLVTVEHPERFPLASVSSHSAPIEQNVTGVVSSDVARNVPVISLASGRVVDIRARLGDSVVKGQILMRIQSADIAQAFSDYREAVADERLARAQLARAKILYDKGAVAFKDLEVAQETEEKADVVVQTAEQRLRVLGADKDNPTSIIDVVAPAPGIITDQQVTMASGTQGLASPNAFTISDMSHVWVLCDVYENDLPLVRLGEYADIRLAAYPNIVMKGRISNIGAILDPNIRTAKVRIEIENPGLMRLGMFVQATFHGRQQRDGVVPASAILHLHDRDWAYLSQGGGSFRRVEVHCGQVIAPGKQEVLSGLRAGDHVAADALLLNESLER
jgi:membrane fusion protein, heavy metal efflux system